jgi:thioredoxin-related protein
MKRVVGSLLVGLTCLSLPACEPASGPAFHRLSLEQALAEAQKQDKIVMIDFGASWCGYCHKMDETTFKDAEVQKFLRDNTVAIKIDYDENRKIAQQYGVTGLPTIVFLDKNGKVLNVLSGYLPSIEFDQSSKECAAVRVGYLFERFGLGGVGVKCSRDPAKADLGRHCQRHLRDHFARVSAHDGGAEDAIRPGTDVNTRQTFGLSVEQGTVYLSQFLCKRLHRQAAL